MISCRFHKSCILLSDSHSVHSIYLCYFYVKSLEWTVYHIRTLMWPVIYQSIFILMFQSKLIDKSQSVGSPYKHRPESNYFHMCHQLKKRTLTNCNILSPAMVLCLIYCTVWLGKYVYVSMYVCIKKAYDFNRLTAWWKALYLMLHVFMITLVFLINVSDDEHYFYCCMFSWLLLCS